MKQLLQTNQIHSIPSASISSFHYLCDLRISCFLATMWPNGLDVMKERERAVYSSVNSMLLSCGCWSNKHSPSLVASFANSGLIQIDHSYSNRLPAAEPHSQNNSQSWCWMKGCFFSFKTVNSSLKRSHCQKFWNALLGENMLRKVF